MSMNVARQYHNLLSSAGYRVSSTHANPLGVKTDAPPEIVWDVMRAWAKQHANPKRQPDPDSYHDKILNKTPTIEVDFSRASAALSAARTNKIARFPLNPEANWGPKRRHTRQPVLISFFSPLLSFLLSFLQKWYASRRRSSIQVMILALLSDLRMRQAYCYHPLRLVSNGLLFWCAHSFKNVCLYSVTHRILGLSWNSSFRLDSIHSGFWNSCNQYSMRLILSAWAWSSEGEHKL